MSKREADYNENNKMVVSNNYVRAVHPPNMSINAMKLFRLVVTQCRLKDDEFFEYDFRITDLAESFQISSQNLYRDVKSMCKTMLQSLLYAGDDNPRHSWEYRTIFRTCRYDQDTGTVTVQLSNDVTDLFLRLKREFTKIPIAALLSMRSKYAIRLFEVMCEKMRNCMPYAGNATEVQLSLEEIRTATGTDKKKTYEKMSNLRTRVLLPALAEIEEAASWKIICEDKKRGRRVVGFRLEVWSRNGWEYIEECKRKGIIPEQIPGQQTIFDYL